MRISHSSRFLMVSDGSAGSEKNGCEVCGIPPDDAPLFHDEDALLSCAEWNTIEDHLYYSTDVGVKKVSPKGEVLQSFPETITTVPDPKVEEGFSLESIVFSPNGEWLLTHSPFGVIGAKRAASNWEARWWTDFPDLPEEQSQSYRSAASFADNRRVALLITHVPRAPGQQWAHSLAQWDITTGETLAERKLSQSEVPQGVRQRLAVTPDGKAVIGFRGRSVYVWPTDISEPAKKVTVSKNQVWDVALHPSGRWFLAVSDQPEVSIWDVTTLKRVVTYDWGIGPARCAAFSPDGMLATVGASTGMIAVQDRVEPL